MPVNLLVRQEKWRFNVGIKSYLRAQTAVKKQHWRGVQDTGLSIQFKCQNTFTPTGSRARVSLIAVFSLSRVHRHRRAAGAAYNTHVCAQGHARQVTTQSVGSSFCPYTRRGRRSSRYGRALVENLNFIARRLSLRLHAQLTYLFN